MRRLAFIVAVLLVSLALPAVASAQYQLAHPKHEHCRVFYVKRIKTVRHRRETFCVHVAPKADAPSTPTAPPATAPAPTPTPSVPGPSFPGPSTPTPEPTAPYVDVTHLSGGYIAVSGGLIGSEHSLGYEQLTYTITDAARDVQLGSFTMSADADCTILETTEAAHTFSGAADAPFAACGLSRVSLPASDNATIAASFAGSSNYAPSTSESQAF